jgi:hypothetical protein
MIATNKGPSGEICVRARAIDVYQTLLDDIRTQNLRYRTILT